MMYRLAEHQQYAEFMMECNEALGIFYEAGTGKTMIALSYCYHAIQRGEASSILVVCPASLTGNWEMAVDKMLQFEGYLPSGVDLLKECMTVRSFQKVYRSRKAGGRRIVTLRDDVDQFWDIVIIDEAHALGGHNSIQTKACLLLAKLAKRRYAMTGTPVSGGGGGPDYKKLYGIIQFLHPGTWRNWSEFLEKYVTRTDRWFKPRGYNNEACEALMKENAIVCRLRDCYDMPEETHTMIPCELAEPIVYRDLMKMNTEKYGFVPENAGEIYPKLLQVVSGSMKVGDEVLLFKSSKDRALVDLLEGTDDAVVVFCNYIASVDRCMAIAARCGRKAVRYDSKAHHDDWEKFQHGDRDVIVCQYKKGGVGLDLFKSHTTIYFEPCWSALELEQSKARTMRTGQRHMCIYIYLTTPKTREDVAWTSVRNGLDLTTDVFERWAREDRL